MGKTPVLLILGIVGFGILVNHTHAAQLSLASLRLDRTKSSSSISGLLCAKPSSAGAGTEGQIAITFPTSFSISNTESDWTTSTASLPSGSTAWPGISSQASLVSGKTVTFSSSDLSSSATRYCFYLSSSTSTTGTTTGSLTGTITTKSGGGSQIDTQGYSLNISTNDQVTVSATVPANSTDFEASLVKTNPAGSTVTQESDVTYRLTYGSSLNYPATITVQAEWELGTLSGSSTPTVDLLEYVSGSASTGYNNATPVIDTVNRTISWEISAFPSDTHNQTVTFQLRTKNVQTGSSPITFDVHGRVIGPGTQTTDSTVTLEYLHGAQVSQPTSSVTATPTQSPLLTSTPTPIPSKNSFVSIDVYEIATTSARIRVETTKPSSIVVFYGETPETMTKQFRSSSQSTSQILDIPNLLLDKVYFFQLIAQSTSEDIKSDIYTFRTPKTNNNIEFDLDSFIVTSNEIIVFDNSYKSEKGNENFFTLPLGSTFTFQISKLGFEQIQRIQTLLTSNNVLGAKTDMDEAAQIATQLIEVRKGVFLARIPTPFTAGVYTLSLQVYGSSGSVAVRDIAKIRVLKPLLVLDSESEYPIEGARIRLSLFNFATKLYQEVISLFKFDGYPLTTNNNGTVNVVLPPGKYRTEVLALGYKPAEIDFTIGPDSGEDYPTILLTKSGFSINNIMSYYADSILTVTSSLEEYISTLFQSRRFYEVINALCIIILITLSLLSLSHHIGLPIIYLPLLLKHHGAGLLRRRKGDQTVSGKIIDSHTGDPLSGVHVFLLDGLRKVALDNALTNRSGVFIFRRLSPFPMTIRCEKQGYIAFTHSITPPLQPTLTYALVKDSLASEAGAILRHTVGLALERFSEFLLIGSIIVEFAFAYSFGWIQALPFLVISLLNFLYYIYYNRVINS